MKTISLMIILTLIAITYHVSTVYALSGATSNKVITKVGSPTGSPPDIGGKSTSSGPLGATVTCPFFKNGVGSVNVTCGSAKNPASNGCGHAIPPAYPACKHPPYASCPFTDQLKAAIDVRPAGSNGSNVPVYLPYINGNESVQWTKVFGPIDLTGFDGEVWGVRIEYSAVSSSGKNVRVDLTHLNRLTLSSNAANSGDQVGYTLPNLDGGGTAHLHVAASINGVWGDSIDQTFICSNKTP